MIKVRRLELIPTTMLMLALVCWPAASFGQAKPIYTGGRTGSYFGAFGPLLRDLLAKSFFTFEVVPSAGSGENIERVLADPAAIGLVQADVLAAEAARQPALADAITVIRADVANECLFAITAPANAQRLSNWGAVQGFARRLTIVTGPEASGSAATLRFLRTLNPNLERATVKFLKSGDAVIDAVGNGEADVGFFVQFADPGNPRFEAINGYKLSFIPVVDRAMLRQKIGGDRPVYVPLEVKVTSAGLLQWRGVTKITTSCTPLVMITGNPARLPESSNERLDQKDMIDAVRAAPVESLRPKESWFQSVIDGAVVATGAGLDKMLDVAEEAAKKIQQ